MPLQGKKIILGISGSIAAYKSLELIRLLVRAGARVCAIPTTRALDFVTQLSLETLTGQEVSKGVAHVEQAYDADLMLIAPATANLMAKMAHGLADELLLQTYLSFQGPVFVAPAMETYMWEHPATQANAQLLKERGVKIMGPESGFLASGRQGFGRLAEPEMILEQVQSAFYPQDWAGKQVLVTAGPTIEELDPVRYLSNYSSGKMGVALARALANRGARVSLIHGPLQVSIPRHPNIQAYAIKSARDLLAYALELAPKMDVAILCAAVADFRPLHRQAQKLKKSQAGIQIEFIQNPDILKALGEQKQRPFLVGFAAETSDLAENATAKCHTKNCDLICANLINESNPAFSSDENELMIFNPLGLVKNLGKKTKDKLAHEILDVILTNQTA